MHRDTRYKWKPIKGENHILLLLWCKGKLQLPLTTDFLQAPTYRRLQPQFCKLQFARKHQLPSIFCRHQPTGGSYLSQLQLTAIKLQLDMEVPSSSHNYENTCCFTWISALFYSFFTAILQLSYLRYLISGSLQLLLFLLLLLPLSSLMLLTI